MMILSLGLAVIFFMVGELLIGLIAIAVGIAAGLSPIWYILKGERSAIREIQTEMRTEMQNIIRETCATNSRLEQIVLSGIDEKITAVCIVVLVYIQVECSPLLCQKMLNKFPLDYPQKYKKELLVVTESVMILLLHSQKHVS
jgi:hypothetical protein